MMKLSVFMACCIFFGILPERSNPCHAQDLDYLFESGREGYHTFRIPAIISTNKGHILAFAEGRKNSSSDTGDIDIVMKRSSDNGRTWGGLQVIWDGGVNVCGNPAPVMDKLTGMVYLLTTWNLGEDREPEIINQTSRDTRRVFVMHSADEGITWSEPREITGSVKKSDWTWYATGPCHGIQVQKGAFEGRMIIPCDHIEADTEQYFSHVIYSDDHGETWKLGGSTPQDKVNECTIAEMPGDRLMLNMRNYDRSKKSRKVSVSRDGGITWGNIYADESLVEPICQASLLRYSFAEEDKSRLIFSNPADPARRENLTLRISYDEGSSWPVSYTLFNGPAAYSDLARLPDGNVGCLYEAGQDNPYQGIVFKSLVLKEIEH